MKGNLFLGLGRKSVGDVVFYKRKGSTEQMARARNRKPNNPRSDKQLYQRAIMATVLQAYSAGKAIFDHSFEGKSVPDGSMNRFMSLNLRKLRAAIAEDLAGAGSNPTPGRVVAPGAVTPVPFAYRISEGSYVNQLLTYDDTPSDPGFKFPTPDDADTTPALYLSNHGFVPGDIYTIVAFGNDPDNVIGIYPDGSLYGCYFGWARLQVRADAPSSGALTLDNLFTVTSSHGIDSKKIKVGTVIGIDEVFNNVKFATGSIGAIRSRYDSGVRSTADMYMVGAGDFGIASTDLLDVWRAGTQQVGDPSLILEGGGSSQPRPAGEPIAAQGNLQIFADAACTRYATGREPVVYCRFNTETSLSPTPAGIAESFEALDGKTPTAILMRTGSSFSLVVWNNWTASGQMPIKVGDVWQAVNTQGTTVNNPSVIMSFGD